MTKKPPQPQDKYVLRLPEGMRDRIKRRADANNRSMNSEILQVLERAFPAPTKVADRVLEIDNLVTIISAGGADEALGPLTSKLKQLILEIETGSIEGISEEERGEIVKAYKSGEYDNFLLRKKRSLSMQLPDWLTAKED